MSITNRLKITISPIRLHSTSSLQIPRSTARFNSLLPTVNVSPLKSSSSWGLGRAAVCDCGTPWTFLLPFFFFENENAQ